MIALLRDRAATHAPDRRGQGADRVFAQAENLADFADRGTAAIGDDGRGNAGAFTAVFFVDVLDHLFAALVLEIDVDVGRLVARGRDETLEQQADVFGVGIDFGDAKAEADRGIGRRAAALAEDVFGAGKFDDLIDGQEIRGIFDLGDELELMRQSLHDRSRHAIGIPPLGAFIGEMSERILRGGEALHVLVGIFVGKVFEREGQLLAQRFGFFDGGRIILEQPRHFLRRLEETFGVDGEPPSGLVDQQLLANAGQHVGQLAPVGMMEDDVIDRDQRHVRFARGGGEFCEPRFVAAAIEHRRGETHATRSCGAQLAEKGRIAVHRDQLEPEHMFEQIVAPQDAIAFVGAPVADGQQSRQPAPGSAVTRIGEDVGRAVAEYEAGAGVVGEGQLLIALENIGPHHAGHRIAIAKSEPGKPDGIGLHHQLFRMRRAAQE